MKRIVPLIETLEKHFDQVFSKPELYRPQRCPHCTRAVLHHHGHYERNTPCGRGQARLGPVPILRFFCPSCRRTCSRLPGCLPPRRHYDWLMQQAVLLDVFASLSCREIARRHLPSRQTVRRWSGRLQDRFVELAFHLRNRFPELGRFVCWRSFFSACLDRMSLAQMMASLDHDGVHVP